MGWAYAKRINREFVQQMRDQRPLRLRHDEAASRHSDKRQTSWFLKHDIQPLAVHGFGRRNC